MGIIFDLHCLENVHAHKWIDDFTCQICQEYNTNYWVMLYRMYIVTDWEDTQHFCILYPYIQGHKSQH